MDNAATGLALDRGNFKYRLVSVIIRASRGGGAGLGSRLSARWRRSIRSTIIADGRTHSILEGLPDIELQSLLDLNLPLFWNECRSQARVKVWGRGCFDILFEVIKPINECIITRINI